MTGLEKHHPLSSMGYTHPSTPIDFGIPLTLSSVNPFGPAIRRALPQTRGQTRESAACGAPVVQKQTPASPGHKAPHRETRSHEPGGTVQGVGHTPDASGTASPDGRSSQSPLAPPPPPLAVSRPSAVPDRSRFDIWLRSTGHPCHGGFDPPTHIPGLGGFYQQPT